MWNYYGTSYHEQSSCHLRASTTGFTRDGAINCCLQEVGTRWPGAGYRGSNTSVSVSALPSPGYRDQR